MEYMLSEALPIYSGGLGNVAGDQLKAELVRFHVGSLVGFNRVASLWLYHKQCQHILYNRNPGIEILISQ